MTHRLIERPTDLRVHFSPAIQWRYNGELLVAATVNGVRGHYTFGKSVIKRNRVVVVVSQDLIYDRSFASSF